MGLPEKIGTDGHLSFVESPVQYRNLFLPIILTAMLSQMCYDELSLCALLNGSVVLMTAKTGH